MSNFQRTRSKVWWEDSPHNVRNFGSPVAQPRYQDNKLDEPDWEPQLPHWIANQPEQQKNNNADNNAQPNNAQINQWPLRHGSPGSHKSQDSGFSDSDSSPPPSQYYPSPESNESKNKSSSSSDSNNNENITVRQVIPNTPQSKDVVDNAKVLNNSGAPTPKPRNRSSSVIQTPYDLQKYYEIHRDEEHMELLKDKDTDTDEADKTLKTASTKNTNNEKSNTDKISKNISPKVVNSKSNIDKINRVEIQETPPNNISNKENTPNKSAIQNDAKDVTVKNSNIISPSKKYPVKKSFVSSTETDSTKISKVAKVKDLETSKNKSDESLEYIKLEDNNEIAVNNQPRMRTPISNVSYVPTERTSIAKVEYKRSMSSEEKVPITSTPKFQRNRLNKSLNFEAQRLDQQILDIQSGHHSLGYIDEDEIIIEEKYEDDQIHKPTKAILGKNIMDSLHLKPTTKKAGPKAKQRMATRADKARDLFRLFPGKKEKPGIVGNQAGGVLDGSRVPSLGLPRAYEQNSWVVVGYPEEKEMLIPHYNERLIGGESDIYMKAKDTSDEDINMKIRRVTPPPEFQDKQKTPYETDSKTNRDLTHDSKREKLKNTEMNFVDVQINLACTSTPKMLAPHEFMNGVTPKSVSRNSRLNLLNKFNSGLVLNNQNEILYRERSIDQTTLERLCERKPEAVQYWLCDLVGSCENECMTTLQSKPLGAEMKAMVSASSATITGNIKKVQTHGQIIVFQYSEVLRQMEENKTSEEQICLLVANINEFVLAHSITLNTKPPGETPERWDKIKKSLELYLRKLIDIGEDVKLEMNESHPEWYLVEKHLDTLIGIFLETTKAVLVQQMKTLVSIIEEPPSDMILKSTLTSIGHLAMLTDNAESSLHEKCSKIMKNLTELPFVDCGVPRALLTAIIESNKSSIKALSLRALATVCVTGDAVKQFEEGGGIEIISDILSDRSNPEPQMREAITVLTQITAPWLRGHYDLTQLHVYLNSVVDNVTGILTRTDCCQLLLLCTACLVNLVRELELEKPEDKPSKSDIVEVLTRHHTVEKLLDAVKRRGPSISVFLQEQTASFLASLSRISRCILLLSGLSSVSAALVCFTRAAPAHAPRAAELRAQARLHCHAAEAISRLAIVPEVAHQIVQLEGVPHLTRLVRMQRTRPHVDVNPDQTLIHCLKALRLIYKHSPEAFLEYEKDVEDMIRPHLMESLMLFSAKQESYV